MIRRLPPELRADLTDYAVERIQAVWNDAGYVDARTLAENIVHAQEFAWMAHFAKSDPDVADRLSNGAYK
jgi:hypothetical protein